MKDPYTVLGLKRNASADEVKASYRKLAKKHHPDLNPSDGQVDKRFKEISQAYSILKDKEKRARFDRGEIDASGQETMAGGFRHARSGRGGAGRQSPFGFEFGEDVKVEDIFSDLFGGRRGPGRNRGQAQGRGRTKVRQKGSNVTYRTKVGFIEAALGVKKRVSLTDGKSLEITIPAGTADGQSLRLKGQGMQGMGGAPAGDAYIEVTIEAHPYFTRQDKDIHLELPISLQEAVLGASVQIPTIHSRVTMKIPPGSNSGTTLRLKGKGIAGPKGDSAGDQIIRLKVVLPDQIDSELAELVRTWSSTHPYEPRGRGGMT